MGGRESDPRGKENTTLLPGKLVKASIEIY